MIMEAKANDKNYYGGMWSSTSVVKDYQHNHLIPDMLEPLLLEPFRCKRNLKWDSIDIMGKSEFLENDDEKSLSYN